VLDKYIELLDKTIVEEPKRYRKETRKPLVEVKQELGAHCS